MKRIIAKGLIFLIVIGATAFGGDAIVGRSEAQAQQKTLGFLLVEFENAVLWSAVNQGFRARQQPWRAECMAAHTGPAFAALLIEFERWVLWSAVDGAWKKRRDSWIKDTQAAGAAGNAGALGKLLTEFESHVQWSAVDAGKWRARRNAWIGDCRSAVL